jgi:hypothetical protein
MSTLAGLLPPSTGGRASPRHARSLREQTINMKNGSDEEPFVRSPS